MSSQSNTPQTQDLKTLCSTSNRLNAPIVCGTSFEMPGGMFKQESLFEMVCGSWIATSGIPISRSARPEASFQDLTGAAVYGAFI